MEGMAMVDSQEALMSVLVAIEEAMLRGLKDRNTEAIEEHVDDDIVFVDAFGIGSGKAQFLQQAKNEAVELKSYSLSDFKLRQLGVDTAVLVYRAMQDLYYDGNQLPGAWHISTVFVKKGGRWLIVSTHDTAVANE